jgi:hypothetical protein
MRANAQSFMFRPSGKNWWSYSSIFSRYKRLSHLHLYLLILFTRLGAPSYCLLIFVLFSRFPLSVVDRSFPFSSPLLISITPPPQSYPMIEPMPHQIEKVDKVFDAFSSIGVTLPTHESTNHTKTTSARGKRVHDPLHITVKHGGELCSVHLYVEICVASMILTWYRRTCYLPISKLEL